MLIIKCEEENSAATLIYPNVNNWRAIEYNQADNNVNSEYGWRRFWHWYPPFEAHESGLQMIGDLFPHLIRARIK